MRKIGRFVEHVELLAFLAMPNAITRPRWYLIFAVLVAGMFDLVPISISGVEHTLVLDL
jgi:hypothetical protein